MFYATLFVVVIYHSLSVDLCIPSTYVYIKCVCVCVCVCVSVYSSVVLYKDQGLHK